MAKTAIAADFNQTLDIKSHVAAEVALHGIVLIDIIPQLGHVVLAQITDTGVGVDPGGGQDVCRRLAAQTENVGQADLNALFSGQVHTCNACHVLNAPP